MKYKVSFQVHQFPSDHYIAEVEAASEEEARALVEARWHELDTKANHVDTKLHHVEFGGIDGVEEVK